MLVKNIFLNVSSRTSAMIFYAIALYPFLYLITLILPTNFMQIGGENNALSGLEFFYGVLLAQSQFAVPLILMTYFISYLFFEEYESGRLIFYKDTSRAYLYNSKLIVLLTMYAIYYLILFISSMILYFTYIHNFDYASGLFLSNSTATNFSTLLSIIGLFCITLIAICFSIMLSMKLSTGFNILGVIVLLMFMVISPMIHGLKYLFPNGYDEAYNLNDFFSKLCLMLLTTFIYSAICYFIGLKMFKRLEY
ncbi:amino acid transporter [Staphylococcus caeli]|uniref:amino acid transporter n=1 Tax=Staphylococcus caeli TaxID=2201815 RepID=UPI003F570918